MAIDLTVNNPLSANMQNVQAGSTGTPINLCSEMVLITGLDSPGGTLPLEVAQGATGAGTWGRILRLRGPLPNQFFDIGIDANGNLFVNGPQSTATNHLITLSPSGVVNPGQ